MGETVRYAVHRHHRWLALAVFSAPAPKCGPRDGWIGRDRGVRFRRLHLVSNSSRFLILPDGPRSLGSRALRNHAAADSSRLRAPSAATAALGKARGAVTRARKMPRGLPPGNEFPHRDTGQSARTPKALLETTPKKGRSCHADLSRTRAASERIRIGNRPAGASHPKAPGTSWIGIWTPPESSSTLFRVQGRHVTDGIT